MVVQVTSTTVPASEGMKPTTMFSPQDIMPNGVSKVTTWRLGSASVTVAFGTDCAAGVASWNSCSNGTLNWNACVVERIPMGVSP